VNCKNCNTKLLDQDQYCKNCGGKVIRNRLTIRNLFEHISETFFNYDNKLLRTLIDLFKKPEAVIGGYINGMRKRYVNPISYIALSLTIGGIYMLILNKFFPNAMAEMSSMGVQEGQEELMANYWSFIQKYYSLFMIMLIPFYALISRLVFVNRKEYNYTEHLVMAMYIMAQFSLVSSILNILLLVFQLSPSILGTASIFLQMAYFGYCYKRLYKLTHGGLALRTLWFLAILLLILIIIVILGFLIGFLFKDSEVMQSIIESQKAAIEVQEVIKDSIN
jgi:hypothetical protein